MRKRRALAFAGLIIIGIVLFQTGRMVEAGSSQPGSQSDPLVTKSYLEQQLSSGGGGYRTVELADGEGLELGAGAELIVFRGAGNISAGSMINLSSSELFKTGNSVVLYSLFVAAEDGAALRAQGAMTVFVRGGR